MFGLILDNLLPVEFSVSIQRISTTVRNPGGFCVAFSFFIKMEKKNGKKDRRYQVSAAAH